MHDIVAVLLDGLGWSGTGNNLALVFLDCAGQVVIEACPVYITSASRNWDGGVDVVAYSRVIQYHSRAIESHIVLLDDDVYFGPVLVTRVHISRRFPRLLPGKLLGLGESSYSDVSLAFSTYVHQYHGIEYDRDVYQALRSEGLDVIASLKGSTNG